ncbi:MAG TPA: DNA polymerase IV, partial [Mariprofundaceae bacterium]|nr:DNA polymerase IV [Mariprofundaceae bacterium]
VLPGKRILRFLTGIAVGDIPGIGRNRQALLCKFDIRTAADFARADEALIHRLLGRHGMVLWQELNGKVVQPLEVAPPIPKSVARTASMGQLSDDRTLIAAHLSHHTHRLVSDLVARGLLAERISVFLTLESFERSGIEMRLDYPTNSLKKITEVVRKAFTLLYQPATLYRGCGTIATHIRKTSGVTHDLFGVMQSDQRQTELMLTINRINRKYGNHMVTSAAASMLGKHHSKEFRFRYPLLSAC